MDSWSALGKAGDMRADQATRGKRRTVVGARASWPIGSVGVSRGADGGYPRRTLAPADRWGTSVEERLQQPGRVEPANGGGAHTTPRRALDAESRLWWERLHASEPIRGWAIAELYERLRREAAFHVRQRALGLPGFPRSDIDDVATQAAGDALVALIQKLEDYRGDSQFWTWARKFAALEAPASIRRRLGRDRVGISDDPDSAEDVADLRESAHDRAEAHELLESVGRVLNHELTARQRIVLTEVAINGTSTAALAEELDTTPGAIYKSLHDARLKVRRLTATLEPMG
jgi:RNA polymerase sigma-70 factor (ECF subfamily)